MFSYSLGFDSLRAYLLFAMILPCRNYNCNCYSTADKPDVTKIRSMNVLEQLSAAYPALK